MRIWCSSCRTAACLIPNAHYSACPMEYYATEPRESSQMRIVVRFIAGKSSGPGRESDPAANHNSALGQKLRESGGRRPGCGSNCPVWRGTRLCGPQIESEGGCLRRSESLFPQRLNAKRREGWLSASSANWRVRTFESSSLNWIRTVTRRLTVCRYCDVCDYHLYRAYPEHAHGVEAHPERPAG